MAEQMDNLPAQGRARPMSLIVPQENSAFAEEPKARGAEFHAFSGKPNRDLWRAHLPNSLIFANRYLTGEE